MTETNPTSAWRVNLDFVHLSTSQLISFFNWHTGAKVAKMESKPIAIGRCMAAIPPKATVDAADRNELIHLWAKETEAVLNIPPSTNIKASEVDMPRKKTNLTLVPPAPAAAAPAASTGDALLAEVLGTAPPAPAPVPAATPPAPVDKRQAMLDRLAAGRAKAAANRAAKGGGAPAQAPATAKAAPAPTPAAKAAPAAKAKKGGNLNGRTAFLRPDTMIKVGAQTQRGVVAEMQALMGKKPMKYDDALETIAAQIDMTGRRTKLDAKAYAKDYVCKWGVDLGYWDVVS